MPRRARTRSLAKWLGTVLTALLLIAWIASTRYSASHSWNVRADPTPAAARPKESAPFSDLTNFDWVFRVNSDRYLPTQFRHQVGFATGRVYFYHDDDNGRGWWEPDDPQWSMRPGFDARIAPERRGFRPAFFALPLWFPVALIGIPTALLWRTDLRSRRLARLNLCTNCGYDLAATAVAAPCPECGKVRPAERAFRAPSRSRRNLARVGAVLTLLLFIAWIASAYVPRTFKWNIRQISPRWQDPVPMANDNVATQMEPSHTKPTQIDRAQRQPTSTEGGTLRLKVRTFPMEYGDEVGFGNGRAWIGFNMPVSNWTSWLYGRRLDLWPAHIGRDASESRGYVSIPLWIPLVLVAIPTALLWRSGRRERQAVRRE